MVGVLLIGSMGRAQTLSDVFGTACTTVGGTGGFEWICTAGQLVNNVEELVTSLHGDMAAFAQDLFESWFSDALSTLGSKLGGAEIDAALQELNDAIAEGPAAFQAKLREVVNALQLANFLAPDPPKNSPDWWFGRATRSNPTLTIGEAENKIAEKHLIIAEGEARAAHKMNEALARGVSESTASREAMAAVLGMPSVPGVPNPNEGTAAELEERARLANSTRTALVYLSEGLADLMRQEAAFSGVIVEHLRVLSQQKVMTTWQLQHVVSTLVREQERAIAEARARLELHIARQYEEGRTMGQALSGIAQGIVTTLDADTSSLESVFGSLNSGGGP